MKTFKKIIRGILTTLLIVCMSLLFLTTHLENMLGSIIIETMKEEISSPLTTLLKDQKIIDSSINNEEITNILFKDEQMNTLYHEYLDTILHSITTEEDLENLDFGTDLSSLIKSHQKELQEKLKVTITDEQIETFEKKVNESPVIKKKITDTVKSMKNQLSDEEKELLTIYRFAISTKCSFILIGFIILLVFLIAILYPSLYHWLFNVALALTITSVLNFIFIPASKSILDFYVQENLNILMEVGIRETMMHTTWMFITSILLFALYYIIRYFIKKNHETN